MWCSAGFLSGSDLLWHPCILSLSWLCHCLPPIDIGFCFGLGVCWVVDIQIFILVEETALLVSSHRPQFCCASLSRLLAVGSSVSVFVSGLPGLSRFWCVSLRSCCLDHLQLGIVCLLLLSSSVFLSWCSFRLRRCKAVRVYVLQYYVQTDLNHVKQLNLVIHLNGSRLLQRVATQWTFASVLWHRAAIAGHKRSATPSPLLIS